MKALSKMSVIIIFIITISCVSQSNEISVDTTYVNPSIVVTTSDTINVLELYTKMETRLNNLSGGFYKVDSLTIYYFENNEGVILRDGKLEVGPELHCTVDIIFLKNGIIQSELLSMPYIEEGWIHAEINKEKKNYIYDKGERGEFNLNLNKGLHINLDNMESIFHSRKMYPTSN